MRGIGYWTAFAAVIVVVLGGGCGGEEKPTAEKPIEWKELTLVSPSQVAKILVRYIQLKYMEPVVAQLAANVLSKRAYPSDHPSRNLVEIEYVYEEIKKYSSADSGKNLDRNEFYKECEKVLYKTLRAPRFP